MKCSDRSKVFDDASSKQPSMTVPDEAMTVPYLLSRYVKGVPLGVPEKHPVSMDTTNFDSPDWEKVKHMDLLDHDDLRDDLENVDREYKKREAAKAKKAKEDKEKALDKTRLPLSADTPPQAGTA